MTADNTFLIFFGIMGMVAGGLVVWLLTAERVFDMGEVRGGPVDAAEASLLVKTLAQDGTTVDEEVVARLLELHAAYFDGRIHDSLAAAEQARLEAAQARVAAAHAAHQERARLARETAEAAARAAQAAAHEAASAPGRSSTRKPWTKG